MSSVSQISQSQQPNLWDSARDVIEEEDEDGSLKTQQLLSYIAQLESELIKERASNQTLKREVERNNGNVSSGSDKNQIQILRLQIEEKDKRISELNQYQQGRTNFESNEQQKEQNYQNLEERLISITLENERLNFIINNQKKTQDSQSYQKQKEFESAVSEQVKEYVDRAEKLIQENEALTVINEKLQLNYSKLDESHSTLQLKFDEKTEELRQFWRDHYEKQEEELMLKIEQERIELQQQLQRKTEIIDNLQSQFKVNSSFYAEKCQLQTQINTSQVISMSLEQQLNENQIRLQRIERELHEKDRELIDAKSRSCVADAKLIQIQCQNDEMREQLMKVAQIERDALAVVDENSKLQQILLIKEQELEMTRGTLQSEKKTAHLALDEQRERCKAQQDSEVNAIKREKEKEREDKIQMGNQVIQFMQKIDGLNKIILQLEDQTRILEQDKEKLLLLISDQQLLQENLSTQKERTSNLENSLQELLDTNNVINQNLNTRLNEVSIWKQRCEKQSEENKRLNDKYQKQIAEINKLTEDELRRSKVKQDETMALISQQMSQLEKELNDFQIESTQNETILRAEHKLRVEIMTQQIDILNEQIDHLQKCIVELEQKHQIDSQTMHTNHLEQLENMRRQLASKHKEAEEIKRVNHTLTQECSLLNSKLSKEIIKRSDGSTSLDNSTDGGYQSFQFSSSQNSLDSLTYFKQAIENLRVENRQLLISKVQEYNSYQDHLRQLVQENNRHFSNTQANSLASPPSQSLLKGKNPFNDSATEFTNNEEHYGNRNTNYHRSQSPPLNPFDRSQSPPQHPLPRSQSPPLSNNVLGPNKSQENIPDVHHQHQRPGSAKASQQSKFVASQRPQSPDQEKEKSSQKQQLTFEKMQSELEYYKKRDEQSSKVLDMLKAENQKLYSEHRELEQKYYTRNDYIVDGYEEQKKSKQDLANKLQPTAEQDNEDSDN